MKKRYIIVCFLLVSCSVIRDIEGNTYIYESKRRTLQLFFENDTICKLKNIFHCADIDSKFKELTNVCMYRRVADTIFLRNMNCKNDSCEYDLILDIPIQNSKNCSFLNKKSRTKQLMFGPNYITEYQKYGLVPKIDIDTIHILKRRMILYKQKGRNSIGFIFK